MRERVKILNENDHNNHCAGISRRRQYDVRQLTPDDYHKGFANAFHLRRSLEQLPGFGGLHLPDRHRFQRCDFLRCCAPGRDDHIDFRRIGEEVVQIEIRFIIFIVDRVRIVEHHQPCPS